MIDKLTIWVIYDSPKDFPGQYVARKFLNDEPTKEFFTGETVEDVRKKLPKGLIRFSRYQNDDPVIVETWF